MSSSSRINLSFLRSLVKSAAARSVTATPELQLTRRSFLALSASGSLSFTLPGRDRVNVSQRGDTVHLLLNDESVCMVSTRTFGEDARVHIHRELGRTVISLRDGFFGGSTVPADFDLTILQDHFGYSTLLEMTNGLQASGPTVPWLLRKAALSGTWRTPRLSPGGDWKITFESVFPKVSVAADWVVSVAGETTVELPGVGKLASRRCEISLVHACDLLEEHVGVKGTRWLFHRDESCWGIDLRSKGAKGAVIDQEPASELFDQLLVESVGAPDALLHAVLLQPTKGRETIAAFVPDGELISSDGEVFSLPLRNVRMAMTLGNNEQTRVLISDAGEGDRWAHDLHASYQFRADADRPQLEWDLSSGQAAVGAQPVAITVPVGDGCMTFRSDEKRPHVFWHPAGWFAPVERFFGWFHRAIPLDGWHLPIERSEDLAVVRLSFENLELHTGPKPTIRRIDKSKDGRITVALPPQHISEQAYYRASGKVKPVIGNIEAARLLGKDESQLVKGDVQKAADMADPDKQSPYDEIECAPTKKFPAQEAELVYRIPDTIQSLPLTVEAMLSWADWELQVVGVARSNAAASRPKIEDPIGFTHIELPWKLQLSTSEKAKFLSAATPVTPKGSEAVELWTTRVEDGSQPPTSSDAGRSSKVPLRAVWADEGEPDLPTCRPDKNDPCKPFDAGCVVRKALNAKDRNEIVQLTSNYSMPSQTADGKFEIPQPFQAEHILLSALGAYMKGKGVWNPGKIDNAHQLTIQQWDHTSTLGRAQFDSIQYKGYLMPFGLAASLVKETRREADDLDKPPTEKRVTASEHQRYYIVVKEQTVSSGRWGVPYEGRGMPWTVSTKGFQSAPLADPEEPVLWPADPNRKQSQSLFWPLKGVDKKLVLFPVTKNDPEIGQLDLLMPMAFVGADVAQRVGSGVSDPGVEDAIRFYNGGDGSNSELDTLISIVFPGRRMALAAARHSGDTDLIVERVKYQVGSSLAEPVVKKGVKQTENANQLYCRDLPFFYPLMDVVLARSGSVDRISPTAATKVAFAQRYLVEGFDLKSNPGEVYLRTLEGALLTFSSGKRVDQAGGLISPDILLTGFSRKSGPVGGSQQGDPSLDGYASGRFDPVDFFGGLASAKILGGIKLSSIIAALAPDLASNLDKVPRMLEEAAFTIGKEELKLAMVIADFQQQPKIKALTALLATESSAVAEAARKVQNGVNSGEANLAAETRLATSILAYANALSRLLSKPQEIGERLMLQYLQSQGLQVPALFDQLQKRLLSICTTLQAKISGVLSLAQTLVSLQRSAVANVSLDLYVLMEGDASPRRVQRVLKDVAPDFLAILDLIPVLGDLRVQARGLAATPITLEQVPGMLDRVNKCFTDIDAISLRITGAKLGLQVAVQKQFETLQRGFLAVWTQVVPDPASVDELEKSVLLLAQKIHEDDARNLLQAMRRLRKVATILVMAAKQWPSLPADPKKLQQEAVTLLTAQRDALAALRDIQVVVESISGLPQDTALVQQAVQGLSQTISVAQLLGDKGSAVSLAFNKAAGEVLKIPVINSFVASEYADLLAKRDDLNNRWVGAKHDLAIQLQILLNATDFVSVLNAPLQFAAYRELFEPAAKNFERALNALPDIDKQLTDAIRGFVGPIGSQWTALRARLRLPITNNEGIEFARNALLQTITPALDKISDAFIGVDSGTTVSDELRQLRQLMAAATGLYDTLRKQIGSISQIGAEIVEAGRAKLAELLANPPFPTSYKVSYDWHPDLRPFEPVFLLEDGADLQIRAEAQTTLYLASVGQGGSPITATYEIDATLKKFSINLIGSPSFVILHIDSLNFASKNGAKPDIKLRLNRVVFGEAMGFVASLAKLLSPSDGPFIELNDGGIRAGYRFAVETRLVGAFVLSGLRFEVAASLPFNGDPMRCIFQISSQQEPCLLQYGPYGGGFFLGLHLGLDGVEMLEGALEFGLVGAMSVGPISGRGFVVAGIYFNITKHNSKVCGFVHAHGFMDIFGFITLTVDVYVAICYESGGSVYGVARVSIHIKIAFFSKTFAFETRQQFKGSSSSTAPKNLPETGKKAIGFTPSADTAEQSDEPESDPAPYFPTQPERQKYVEQFVD